MEKDIQVRVDEAIKLLIEDLKKGISENLIKYLEFCSRFHQYSANNSMLIYLQMPSATKVAGFRSWNEMGYKVKKGSKGIKILRPETYYYIEIDGERIFYNQMTKEQKADKSKHEKGIRYVQATVFDISQVEPLNDEVEEIKFFAPLGNSHKEQYENLKNIIEKQNIKVTEGYTGEAEGLSHGGLIEIKKSIDYNNKLLVLIHEFAHELLDKGADSDRDLTTSQVRECRAEAVSYIVGQYIGLKNPYSCDYLLSWGNTEQDIKDNLDRILKAAYRIIELIKEEPTKVNKVA